MPLNFYKRRSLPLDMLKNIAYVNLSLAVVYFLLWLQQGSYYAITGIVVIVLFCIYTLWAAGHERWGNIRFLAVFPVVIISGWLLVSGWNLIRSGLESGYQNAGMIFLCVYCLVFGLTLFVHVVVLGLKNNSPTV